MKNLHFETEFNANTATVTNVCIIIVFALYDVLFIGIMVCEHVPLSRKNANCLPMCFTAFSNCCMVIDCTEISTGKT